VSSTSETERRRLAGMLPGAEVVEVAAGSFVALVRDVDVPIPVLVERGRYSLVPGAPAGDPALAGRSRTLAREGFRLVLVDSPEELTRLTRGG
jgi:hypothetical protein